MCERRGRQRGRLRERESERERERERERGDPPTLVTVRAVQLNFTRYEAANGM